MVSSNTTAGFDQKHSRFRVKPQLHAKSVKKDLASASRLKRESIKEINENLVGYINTMVKVNPATYEATAKTMAELIDKNNELVKRRKKNKRGRYRIGVKTTC
ncbi:hypothetical protein BZG01_13215 [Labilibaculum manganireducens]|uniref:Uncharacterized protein n=1 Tax=Labilibaculum manganireducens TaxID=1940525 RepID=A0A2N3I521_9BACT|nr:hypothetical protein BZG01_13215 [Labilibaculum manganireducens]